MKVRMARLPMLVVVLLALVAAGGAALRTQDASAGALAPGAAWSSPQNVTQVNTYSNSPALAALQTTGQAVMAWEERDLPSEAKFSQLQVSRSDCPTCPMGPPRAIEDAGYKLIGNPNGVHDSLGRAHFSWYQYDESGVAIYYARYANGTWERVAPIAVTRSVASNPRKMNALAVGPDNQIWLINGRDEVSMNLYRSADGANWVDEGPVPTGNKPKDISMTVSSLGQVMVGWVDRGTDLNGDAFAGQYLGGGNWNVFNLSNDAGKSTHNTSLAADRTGGIRMAYDSVQRCEEDSCYEEIYYREWTPAGGWSPNIVNLSRSAGSSYQPIVRVDHANVAWVVWMDDTGRSYHNYRLMFSTGSGTTFSAPTDVAPALSASGAQVKDASLDTSPGYVQLGFSSTANDPLRDNYYTFSAAGGTAAATQTPVPPASTPTMRPDCKFYDVCQADWYYTFVTNLVSRGAIAGYADGRFRPHNTITRGQTAKILVSALGLPIDTAGGPHFNDVSTDNPFYQFVETAAKREIVSGYADGSFRPFNEVTRSQLAKMVVAARGYELYRPARATFSDVSPTNAFFAYVETANRLGVLSGYSDGTFQPFNTATRAQGSKIIDMARVTNPATSTPTRTATVPATSTPVPTNTAVPTNTPLPTNTPAPTNTATQAPATATATMTATPESTRTAVATATRTATPGATGTATATRTRPAGAPEIQSFDPAQVVRGDTQTQVKMKGRNFGEWSAAASVTVNGVPVLLDLWSDTEVRFRLAADTPAGSPSTVVLTRADGETDTSRGFTVTAGVQPGGPGDPPK